MFVVVAVEFGACSSLSLVTVGGGWCWKSTEPGDTMRRTTSWVSGLFARFCEGVFVDCRPCVCNREGLLLVTVGVVGWLSVAVLGPEFTDVEVCDVAELDVRCGIEVVEVCRLCCDIAKGDQPKNYLL